MQLLYNLIAGALALGGLAILLACRVRLAGTSDAPPVRRARFSLTTAIATGFAMLLIAYHILVIVNGWSTYHLPLPWAIAGGIIGVLLSALTDILER